MILAWTLLIALAADGGITAPPELRPACKPPGSWDEETKQCKPGCGIPLRWENGVQVGGCDGEADQRPLKQPEEPVKRKKTAR
jgi:hypothetical protein